MNSEHSDWTPINDQPNCVPPGKFDSTIPGWTSYKIHVDVMRPQEATDSTDIYGNVWRNWHATSSIIKRTAFIQGLAIGFVIGALGTLIFLAHMWVK